VLRIGKHIAFILSVLLFTACEVISENERLIPAPVSVDSTERTHVLIEFTGFRCVNCPKASAAAEALKQTYGERLIVVAMHPASNPFTQGAAQYDYTCPQADVYYRYMGGSATTPFPTGNINITDSEDRYLSDYPEWATLLAQQMNLPTSVHLSLQAQRDSNTITVTTTASADQPHDYHLVTWLVEDSVQGAQALPDGSVDRQYYHRHMLRTAAGDAWGENYTIPFTPVTLTSTLTLPDGCDPTHCSIVVAALDDQNRIINARQTTIQ